MDNQIQNTNHLDKTVQAPTVDQIIEARFETVAQAVNSQFEKLYEDFNLTLEKLNRDMQRSEMSNATTVNILFGIINDQKLQVSSLTEVLKRDGLDLDVLEDEYNKQKAILVETGEWQEHALDSVIGSKIDQQNQEEPGLIR